MHVIINAKKQEIPDASNLTQLLVFLNLQNKRLAIEVNKELVPRSLFTEHQLQLNDQIEIVQAIGGG
jgi:thiamine biosynthesis protein ThiS